MKRVFSIIASLLLILSFLWLPVETINAQPVLDRFDQSYKEYKDSIIDYREKFDDYVLARSQYIRFKTLQSETEAINKTRIFLDARDNVTILYFETLLIRLEDASGIDSSKRGDLLARVGDEITWFNAHKNRLPSAQTLDELVADSDEAKFHFEEAQPLIFSVLSEVSIGKVDVYTERFVEIFEGTRNKLDTVRADEREEYKLSDRQLDLLDKWTQETENSFGRAEVLRKEIGVEPKEEIDINLRFYNAVLSDLSLLIGHLKEGGSYIQEIVRVVTIKD